jgi:hypothetical protein
MASARTFLCGIMGCHGSFEKEHIVKTKRCGIKRLHISKVYKVI